MVNEVARKEFTGKGCLLQRQYSFALGCSFQRLLVFHDINQFFTSLGAANHEDAHQLVVAEEQFTVVFIALLTRFAQ